MPNPLRVTSVQGSFYPNSCQKVTLLFNEFHKKFQQFNIQPNIRNIKPRMILAPHAGYVYSGFTAYFAYRFLKQTQAKRIIVIGPSHHHNFEGISGSYYEAFQTPCGNIPIDTPYLIALAKTFNISFQEKAHKKEHSTEVQMPFIQHFFPKTKVIELIYGKVDTNELSKIIIALLSNPDNLVVISSDLSHFHNLDNAKKHDNICLSSISKLDRTLLKIGCEACGYQGIEAMIIASNYLKFSSKLLDYRTSAEYGGDTKSVVGYLSAMFYR